MSWLSGVRSGMAAAYSLDLRQKVFAAYQGGEGSQEQVAARFGVSPSFVRDLAALFRAQGSVVARPRGGGRTSSITPEVRQAIVAAVSAQNDATIAEYRQSLAAAGHLLSHSALGRALLALKLTRKKRPSKTTKQPPSVSRGCARSLPGKWLASEKRI